MRHTFCDLSKKTRNQLLEDMLPRESDLLIHLRPGDVLNTYIKLNQTNDAFEYGVLFVPSLIQNMRYRAGNLGWWHYIKSKCYYKNMLSQLKVTTVKTDKDVTLTYITNTTTTTTTTATARVA